MSKLITPVMWLLFLAGLVGAIGGKHLVHGNTHMQNVATFGGIGLSLVAGAYVSRREPLKSFLRKRSVIWFLFLFNLTLAIAALLFVHGSAGIMAAGGLGLVSLGAGAGLVTSRRGDKARSERHRQHPAGDGRTGNRQPYAGDGLTWNSRRSSSDDDFPRYVP